MAKIAVITPVSHLDGVVELLESKGNVFLYENANKLEVKQALLKHQINTIVCNPNQQTYKIDEELLGGTKVTLINSCSTGLNHIDLEYCQDNKIKIQCHKNDYELINQQELTWEDDKTVPSEFSDKPLTVDNAKNLIEQKKTLRKKN